MKKVTKMLSISVFICLITLLFSSCCCPPCNNLMQQTGTDDTTPGTDVSQKTPSASGETPATTGTGEEKEVKVDALYYLGGNPPSGGSSEVIIKAEKKTSEKLKVSFGESEAGGTGNMWRSSGWMAVVLANMLLGKDATDYEFSFDTGGRIDGPSAGCLMTVGTLAALRGQQVKEDATMTGTINPDGTIGPVGGIPQKLYGAQKKGKTLVLIPAGQRYSIDMGTKASVDVVEKGKKLGLEVKEVSNVYEAYKLLTGDSLPQMEVSDTPPQLPSKAFDRFKGRAKEWYSRYKKLKGEYKSFPKDYQTYFSGFAGMVDELAQKADNALSQGMASVAYDRATGATVQMDAIVLAMNMIQRYQNSGFDGAVSYLESKESVKTELSAAMDNLKAEDVESTSDYVALFEAYSKLTMAEGFILLADDKISVLQKNAGSYDESQLMEELYYVGYYYCCASALLTIAKDCLDIAKDFGSPATVNNEDLVKLGEIMAGAAKANMSYFESTIVDEYAKSAGVHSDVMKYNFMKLDNRYMMAFASTCGVELMKKEFSETAESAPMIIGEASSTYTLSAQLIAKFYSLDPQFDKNYTQVVSIKNERALANMLNFADKRALSLIQLNGEENSVLPICYYENASLLRQGNSEEQIEALGYYWRSTILSEIQAYMSGKLGEN